MKAIFENACPNCGGPIDDERLMLSAPCRNCLDIPDEQLKQLMSSNLLDYRKKIVELLEQKGTLQKYAEVELFEREVADFKETAKKALGVDLWDAQVNWACKALSGKSFAITAPTGLGKTTFGLLYALRMAMRGKKCYVMVPTSVLVEQARKKLDDYSAKIGVNVRILCYHAGIKGEEREAIWKAIESGDFDILVTTSQFLARYFEKLKGIRFDLVFVDDVDALLKASKNIERVLQLLGFTPKIIETALDVIRAKRWLTARAGKEEGSEVQLKIIREGQEEIERFKRENKVGMLIVSTATGKPRGLRVKLFRELLGFEVGSKAEQIRNVADLYVPQVADLKIMVAELVQRLGGGGLIYVPMDMGIDYAEHVAGYLRECGIRAEVFYSKEKKRLEDFVNGEIEVLVGVANYYGLLVRGIDLPQRIRYAIFAGVPRIRFSLAVEEASPMRVLQLLIELREVLEGDEKKKAEAMIARLSRDMDVLQVLIKKVEGLTSRQKLVLRRFEEAKEFVSSLLRRSDVRRKLEENPYVSIKEIEGKLYIVIPDAPTYIQASGRTSRVFAGGISKGISIVIVDDEKVFSGLVRKTKWMSEEIEWRKLSEVDLDKLVKEVNKDRKLISDILAGKISAKTLELVKSALLIVESPNKAKTIASFFGRPAKRIINGIRTYEVSTGKYVLSIVASGGHVYDLVTPPPNEREEDKSAKELHGVLVEDNKFIPRYTSIKRCRKCGEQFTYPIDKHVCPKMGSKETIEIEDAAERIKSFKELAREVSLVLIGTDPDVEGEKIGWDVGVVLRPYAKEIKRIEFHEITRRAILKALEQPREIDEKMVEAQIVRRIEDRWIGFELSKRLWQYFNNNRLSAGRVQTPVLGWVIERAEEWNRSWRWVYIVTLENGVKIVLDNIPQDIDHNEFSRKIFNQGLVIENLEFSEEVINPPPPYTTDTMLRDASAKLRLSATETMKIAQDLFELGFITYHRTDSTRVSDAGMNVAKTYISEAFGEQLFKARSWMMEGAHECIRPTRPLNTSRLLELIREGVIRPIKRLTSDHIRLYDMIFTRFIASQMAPAKVVKQKFTARVDSFSKEVEGYVDVVEEGYTKVMPLRLTKRVKEGMVSVINVTPIRKPDVKLFTQGELVQLMKERGIGRPSTYAKIIDVLRRRGYIIESKYRKELLPTKIGRRVYDFLKKMFGDMVSEERTRIVEEKMDLIERGELDYQRVLSEFYEEIKQLPPEIEAMPMA
ncbi:MAG: reverse gyrase [Candidatus Methanomethylicota archaeon]|uniref:Reverse gyrase n=1 Tax=Thermoproteota archaeon TaxID=2056631 RepID=A0A497ET63_9CREN|nr:MAG: reverse gyrase [Candidatus Verstraetearchaeota archaeon]